MSLFEFLLKEANQPFSGWDFSYISDTGRCSDEPLKWSYTSAVIPKIRQVDSMLDMGTGGGEFLSMLHPLPKNTYATEGYEPNIPIAKNRLEPLGVQVIEKDGEEVLPLPDNSLDLIINKHESFNPSELKRILRKGGYFITQQVGGQNLIDLNRRLKAKEDYGYEDWNLSTAKKQLEKTGLTVIKSLEAHPYCRFFDVGAIVYYLKAIPWQIDNFCVEDYFEALQNMHEEIKTNGI